MELVIKAGDGDSFLKAVLPPDGMRMPIEFGLTWSPSTGVVFHGGATLEVDLPIDLDLTSSSGSRSSTCRWASRCRPGKPPELALGVGATVEWSRPGLRGDRADGHRAGGEFPDAGRQPRAGRPRLRFLPPKGMALSVDAGRSAAAATCCLDFEKGEYAGILHLEIADTSRSPRSGCCRPRCPTESRASRWSSSSAPSSRRSSSATGSSSTGSAASSASTGRSTCPRCRTVRRGAVGSLLFPRTDPAGAADHRRRRRDLPADRGPVRARADGQAGLGRRAS